MRKNYDRHIFSLFFNNKNFKNKKKKAFYLIKKKIFQDFQFLQILLIMLSFILSYVKILSVLNFSRSKKNLKKVFLDIQKFQTNHM